MVPRRLAHLPCEQHDTGMRVYVARTALARLLGLALLADLPRDLALRLPRCSSVHTFGMRFAIDVAFLDREGDVLRIARAVPPCRIVREPGAAQVLEWRSGGR